MFRRGRRDEDVDADAIREEARRYVPASVKAPELQRFAQPELEPDEEEDADLAFLARLAVETDEPEEPAPRTAPARQVSVAADELRAFREVRMAAPEPPLGDRLGVPEVDLDDLLDDLSTTAAALRRRKAA